MNYQLFSYKGTSMYPTLKKGDMLVVLLNSVPVKGDIVTFTHTGRIICHRVVAVKKFKTVTRGDNHFTLDQSNLSSHDIQGVVRFIVRNGKVQTVRNGMGGYFFQLGLLLKKVVYKIVENPFSLLRFFKRIL